ncbi:MAG: ACP S-malonyltransferase [Gemmatimonadetes bacterium]|nr:ACP S-malonyltransferase [Gemmatimonadota bacterium]
MPESVYSRTAFLFPGQGSQAVGMGLDLFDGSPAAREVFREVDDALGHHLSRVIFEGPEETLRRTENAQPAIAAVSLACLKAVEEALGEAPSPAMYAGHSLGEYTALAASGVLGIGDTARLVAERGRLMQLACDERPGGMAALIGIDELAAAEVCRETGTTMANINGAQQIIISGDHMNLAQALDLAAARGAKKCILLKVGGAFHSGHMAPARDGLGRAVRSLAFRSPTAPIIGNVEARPLRTGAELKEELAAQLTACVQWHRSVEYMLDRGIERFVELGPGNVLTGLVRRTNREAQVVNVSDLASAKGLAA